MEMKFKDRSREHAMPQRSRGTALASASQRILFRGACLLLLAGLTIALLACGGSSKDPALTSAQVAGNWQFAMATTAADSFIASPLQGGFLLQKDGAITGQSAFSIVLTPQNGGNGAICNSGTATITGMISGPSVNLTAMVGTLNQYGNPTTQTITLTGGTLSSDGLTIKNGTYSLTPGYYIPPTSTNVAPCGSSQDAGMWSATLIPPLAGGFQGFFHSSSFQGQNFPVSGTLSQGPNTGTSFATVTGTLVFQDPATLLNDYPCLSTASVNGEISGSNVSLQIFGNNGVVAGQIGGSPPMSPVTFDNSTTGGLLLQGQNGYAVANKACTNDVGNVCLAFGSSTGCKQPIVLSPLSLTFPNSYLSILPPLPPVLGSPPATQTVTITNTTGSPLGGVTVQPFATLAGSLLFYQLGGEDFNGEPSFTILQTGQPNDCTTLAPLGSPFTLQTNCTVTVQFAPQESCPWLPAAAAAVDGDSIGPPVSEVPSLCPATSSTTLIVNTPASATKDSDGTFSLPVSGVATSAIVPSTGELDFGSETVGEASPPQTLTFTNDSAKAVQVLPGANTCNTLSELTLPYPLTLSSSVAGFQVDRTGFPADPRTGFEATIVPVPANINVTPPTPATLMYFCDFDSKTLQSNFQIAPSPASSCLGSSQGIILQPQQSCTLQVTFAPQPEAWKFVTDTTTIGLDYFIELNTVQCGSGEPNCEIDSGRFPVELKTGPLSPLRMSPAAAMEFGIIPKGTTSSPLSITVFNDPVDPNSAAVNFTAKLTSGDYFETDNCPPSLSPNQSCTITVTFTPTKVGVDPGSFTLTYNAGNQIGLLQTIYLRGMGQ